jgi:hypothetical protein
MEQQKCSSCKCYKPKEEFIKKGRPIKTCIGCRNKSKVQRNTDATKAEEIRTEIQAEIQAETQTEIQTDIETDIQTEIQTKIQTHDLLLHQRKMKAVLKQYWKQADYAIHVFKLKQSFAEIHDYLIATEYVGHCF